MEFENYTVFNLMVAYIKFVYKKILMLKYFNKTNDFFKIKT